jgi:hypothetical protein
VPLNEALNLVAVLDLSFVGLVIFFETTISVYACNLGQNKQVVMLQRPLNSHLNNEQLGGACTVLSLKMLD